MVKLGFCSDKKAIDLYMYFRNLCVNSHRQILLKRLSQRYRLTESITSEVASASVNLIDAPWRRLRRPVRTNVTERLQ